MTLNINFLQESIFTTILLQCYHITAPYTILNKHSIPHVIYFVKEKNRKSFEAKLTFHKFSSTPHLIFIQANACLVVFLILKFSTAVLDGITFINEFLLTTF